MINRNSTISSAQYRSARQQAQRAASRTNVFGGMLARAAGASDAEQAMMSSATESWQLPDGRWTDGFSIDNSKFYSNFSPSMQLEMDYEAWSAGRPALSPPDSTGLTEANLNYLRERYSGSLSEFERMEALQALMNLGVLSREEYRSAMGFGGVRCAAMDGTFNGKSQGYIGGASGSIRQGPLGSFENEWCQQWENIHVHSPFAKFDTLDDVLSWTRRTNIAGLAEKYDPHHMSQAQYDAFLDELEQKGMLSASGGKLFGGEMEILETPFPENLPSLEEMDGDAVRLVKAMLESEMDRGAVTDKDRQRIEALKTVSEILGQM